MRENEHDLLQRGLRAVTDGPVPPGLMERVTAAALDSHLRRTRRNRLAGSAAAMVVVAVTATSVFLGQQRADRLTATVAAPGHTAQLPPASAMNEPTGFRRLYTSDDHDSSGRPTRSWQFTSRITTTTRGLRGEGPLALGVSVSVGSPLVVTPRGEVEGWQVESATSVGGCPGWRVKHGDPGRFHLFWNDGAGRQVRLFREGPVDDAAFERIAASLYDGQRC